MRGSVAKERKTYQQLESMAEQYMLYSSEQLLVAAIPAW